MAQDIHDNYFYKKLTKQGISLPKLHRDRRTVDETFDQNVQKKTN